MHISQKATPIFIIGSARSGTSILATLMRNYLNVSFGTESQFIIRVYQRLSHYGDIRNDINLKRLLLDISEERCFQRWKKFGYDLDIDRIYRKVSERSYAGVLDAIFMDLAEHLHMDRWGDKTPEYISNLDILHGLFPNAKFVHIVRDGRDVAISTLKTHFGAKNVAVAALQWQKQMDSVIKFKGKVGNYQFYEFRYEDFLNHPVDIFLNLVDFLEIGDPHGQIANRIKRDLKYELKANNYFKWKTELHYKQQVLYEKINFRYLELFGYPTVTNGTFKMTYAERIWYLIDNKAKQLTRLDTWKDNIYKLGVRLRYLKRTLNIP